jgi:hypothetical protein
MGIETGPNSLNKPEHFQHRGAESGAPTSANLNIDPDLALLLGAWPNLPDPIKAAVRALVESAAAAS